MKVDEYGVNIDRPDYQEIKQKMDEYYKPYSDLGKAGSDFFDQICELLRIPKIVRWLSQLFNK